MKTLLLCFLLLTASGQVSAQDRSRYSKGIPMPTVNKEAKNVQAVIAPKGELKGEKLKADCHTRYDEKSQDALMTFCELKLSSGREIMMEIEH